MSLVSRHLEENGIPTVIVGSAQDIVQHCGVARFLFQDFPLGNSIGKPWDVDMQSATVGMALELLETATRPRTMVQTPFAWSNDPSWRETYARITPEKAEELRKLGEQRRARQQQVKADGRARSD